MAHIYGEKSKGRLIQGESNPTLTQGEEQRTPYTENTNDTTSIPN